MLLTTPAVLKPNSSKWRLPVNSRGLSELNNGKAHKNAANVATQFQKNAAKRYQVASIALSARVNGSKSPMKHFVLKRRYFSHGTYSTLHRADGSVVCCVVERAWLNNAPSQSCIPEGSYALYPHQSPKFGDCYALESKELGVTRYGPSLRTHILIHKANSPKELEGCLAPGVDFGFVGGEWAVMNSTAAFNSLMAELASEPANLTIVKD